jgi:hypothetical protein
MHFMAIDFHDVKNQATYTGRDAHADRTQAIRRIVDPAGKRLPASCSSAR